MYNERAKKSPFEGHTFKAASQFRKKSENMLVSEYRTLHVETRMSTIDLKAQAFRRVDLHNRVSLAFI